MLSAVGNVKTKIAPALLGFDACDQVGIDHTMLKVDGTKNKSKLGANAVLGVSLATAHAAANALGQPLYKYIGGPNAKVLPVPMMNIMNGGAHSDAPIDFQEFMIRPVNFRTFSEALRAGAEVFHALDAIAAAVKAAGYKLGKDIMLALDVASSEFYDKKKKKYVFKKSSGKAYSGDEFVSYYKELVAKYPIDSIEDGCDENDWASWKKLTDAIGDKCQLPARPRTPRSPTSPSRPTRAKSKPDRLPVPTAWRNTTNSSVSRKSLVPPRSTPATSEVNLTRLFQSRSHQGPAFL